MPWDIRQNFGSCTGFAVVKREDDEIEGCHDTRDEAEAQLAALNASESDSDDNPVQGSHTEEHRREQERMRRRRRQQRPQVQGYDEHGNAVLDLSEHVEYVEEPTFKSQQ